jgi:hypothetical protein
VADRTTHSTDCPTAARHMLKIRRVGIVARGAAGAAATARPRCWPSWPSKMLQETVSYHFPVQIYKSSKRFLTFYNFFLFVVFC